MFERAIERQGLINQRRDYIKYIKAKAKVIRTEERKILSRTKDRQHLIGIEENNV